MGLQRGYCIGVDSEQVYSALVKRSPDAEQELNVGDRRHLAGNGLRLVTASAMQSSGDQTVNASTVLPWLFHALGVPPALIGVLVPIREAGSMLPQALLTPLVLKFDHRKWVFVAGAVVQAACVGAMATTAAFGGGLVAGLIIVLALATFALGRCLCSIASKDVQGRTVPKGERGQINGLATTASGLVAVTLGLGIRLIGGADLSAGQLAWLLAAGACLWVGAATVYSRIREPSGAVPQTTNRQTQAGRDDNWFVQIYRLVRDDRDFRHFIAVRGLLLVSALSPPFVVSLAVASGTGMLSGLGGFIVASGLAALVGGRIFGRLADRSSRKLMSAGAGAASLIIVVMVSVASLPGFTGGSVGGAVLFTSGYFLLTLLHTGVRVARKTYVVDLAAGDLRTTYVAVSNSAMGVVLLLVGAVSSLLAVIGIVWALVFLAGLGFIGVAAGATLPEVSRESR